MWLLSSPPVLQEVVEHRSKDLGSNFVNHVICNARRSSLLMRDVFQVVQKVLSGETAQVVRDVLAPWSSTASA